MALWLQSPAVVVAVAELAIEAHETVITHQGAVVNQVLLL
jgi:hypothetical protein